MLWSNLCMWLGADGTIKFEGVTCTVENRDGKLTAMARNGEMILFDVHQSGERAV